MNKRCILFGAAGLRAITPEEGCTERLSQLLYSRYSTKLPTSAGSRQP